MKPEENSPEVESEVDDPSEVQSSEVFSAAVSGENTPSDPVEVVEAQVVSEADGGGVAFEKAADDSVLVGVTGEGLWGDTENYWTKKQPKLPSIIQTKVARVCFAVAAVISLVFLLWYCIYEVRGQQNPLVIIRHMLSVTLVMLLGLAGLARVQNRYVPTDAKWIAWIGALISIVCFLAILPPRWRWISLVWVLFQLPPIIASMLAPALSPEDEQYNLNDSIAANGGAIASVVLGSWSVFGALFTVFSIVNSFSGMVLGAWGLTSRKKGLAVLGLILCVIGALACIGNVAGMFLEVLEAQEDELMQSGF